MLRILLLIFIVTGFHAVTAQDDSTRIEGTFALLGRWQTGNLSQFSINPSFRIKVINQKHAGELSANYHYMQVNKVTVIDDLWVNGIYRNHPHRKVFAMVTANYGFAQSYRIEQSFIAGGGAGINVIGSSSAQYVQFHVFGGYLYFQFENIAPHSSPAAGTILSAATPMGNLFTLFWELQSYHSFKQVRFSGLNNRIIVHWEIRKDISLNISHNTIYNHKNIEGIENLNTAMLFGLQYAFNKN